MLAWLFKKNVKTLPKKLAKYYKLKTKSIDEIVEHYDRMGMYNPFFTPQSHRDELESTVAEVEEIKDGWVKFKKVVNKQNEETRSSRLYYAYTVENFLKDHEYLKVGLPNMEEVLKSSELSRKFLQDAGIINEDGTLTEHYK